MRLPEREPRKQSETSIQYAIREALNARDDVRVFRNNVGKLMDHTGRWIQYGLSIGSPDLIGMVHTHCPTCGGGARFLGIETKMPGKNLRDEQQRWFNAMEPFRPILGVATSVEDANIIVERAHWRPEVQREG